MEGNDEDVVIDAIRAGRLRLIAGPLGITWGTS